MWDSELDVAVANALTRMPRERRASDRPPAAEGALKRPDGAAANGAAKSEAPAGKSAGKGGAKAKAGKAVKAD